MTQNIPTPQWKSLIGCLGRRVLSISLLLLVLPLMIHAVLLYKEAVHQSIIDNLNNLALLSRSEATYVQQFIHQNVADIKTVNLLGNYSQKVFEKGERPDFSDIALSESLSSFFLAEKKEDNTWEILAAANPERLIQKDLNPEEYNKILSMGTSVYLFKDPIIQKKELRIGYAISKTRIIVSGTPLERVSSTLVRAPSIKATPIAAFITSDTDLYYSSSANFDLSQAKLFSPLELIDISEQPLSNFQISPKDNFIGVKIPISQESFSLVIALSRAQFYDISSQRGFNHLLQLTILFAFIGGGGVLFLTSRIARPLKQLFGCLDQVGEGNLKIRYQNDPVGFELNILGQKFNQMLTNLENNIQEAKEQRLAKELLKQEFGIGQDIQKAILKTSLSDAKGYLFSTAFTPALEVSGDFYDVYRIDENHLLIACADTAGKGISACLYSLGARSMFRALARSGLKLETILSEMNEMFLDDAENQGTFITAFVAILDLQTNELTYASCGHPPAYLITNQNVTALKAGGLALGVSKDMKIELQKILINQGDKILLYTDGVFEAQNPENEMYGLKRLEAFLNAKKQQGSQVLVLDLQKEVETFSQQGVLSDDLTIFCIEKKILV